MYEKNSVNVCNHLLRNTLVSLCSNSSVLLTGFIPVYSALIAGLHFIFGTNVSSFVVEHFVVEMFKLVEEYRMTMGTSATTAANKDLDKRSANFLLLVLYLYNFRVIYHSLVVDILNYLVGLSHPFHGVHNQPFHLTNLDVELIAVIIDHAGVQLRADDPLQLKAILLQLSKLATEASNENNAFYEQGRVRFLIDLCSDLKNNKSKKTQANQDELIKSYRKWLGSIKTSLGCRTGDNTMKIALKDFLQAETKGRWWKAGAYWMGNQDGQENSHDSKERMVRKDLEDDRDINEYDTKPSKDSSNLEEQKLMKMAVKMRMTTPMRKKIFFVLMGSSDVHDAFEKIARLDLKGKQDRDVARVIVECCIQEKQFNEFYGEISSLLCQQNRQYKVTFQYTLWDLIKSFDSEEVKPRKAINLARLMVHLILHFDIPLSAIKIVDVMSMNETTQLFMATLFFGLFSNRTVSEFLLS